MKFSHNSLSKKMLAAAACALLAFGSASAVDLNRIYTVGDTVDRAPKFPGGDHLIKGYVDQHISNPNLTGNDQPVYCAFVVGPYNDIDLRSIRVLRRGEDGVLAPAEKPTPYEKAVVEVVRGIPGFIAAEVDGERVAYRYILTLNTTLEEKPVLAESVGPKKRPPLVTDYTPSETSPQSTQPYNKTAYAGPREYNGQRLYTPWDRVDRRPEYPGGGKEMYKAIRQNLKVPHNYTHQKTIHLAFVVLPNGEIDQETIKCLYRHPDGHYTDVEQYTSWEYAMMDALTYVKGFNPALADGSPVPYFMVVPLVFR